jgi:hypothetical protein
VKHACLYTSPINCFCSCRACLAHNPMILSFMLTTLHSLAGLWKDQVFEDEDEDNEGDGTADSRTAVSIICYPFCI